MAQSYEQLQIICKALRTENNKLSTELRDTRAELRADNNALRTENNELSTTLNEREQLIGTLYGELHQLKRNNPNSAEVDRLSALLDASDRDNDRLRALYFDMNNALNTASIDKFKLRAAYDALDKMCSDGKAKLGAAREEIRLLNEEINENNNIVINVAITRKPRITCDAR